MASRRWTVRLTATAEVDFQGILLWTADRFGKRQASVYAKTLSSALEALTAEPDIGGAKARDDIASGLYSLHVARRRRKGRHFVIFRIHLQQDRQVIEILRILHEAMDLPSHLPPEDQSS